MAKRRKKTAGGRPPLPPGVAKDVLIKVRCTSAELALADALAARLGIDRSELVRKALLTASLNPDLIMPRHRLAPDPDRPIHNRPAKPFEPSASFDDDLETLGFRKEPKK